MSIRIGGVKLATATAPGGAPQLRLAVEMTEEALFGGDVEATRDLDRNEVVELRDALGAWLAGEVLR